MTAVESNSAGKARPLRIWKPALWLLAVVLVSWQPADAGLKDEILPTDHWAYSAIEELYAAGFWGRWPIGTRPWYRGDIAERLAELREHIAAEPAWMPKDLQWQMNRLYSEFDDELHPERRTSEMETRIGGHLFGLAQFDRFEDALYRGRVQGYFGIGTGPWWVRMRGDIDSHGDLDPTFFGRVWKDQLTGTVDLAYFTIRAKGFELEFGRDFLRWGSAPNDVLLLNDQSPPFDMARAAYQHKFFTFTFFVTGLDSAFTHPADDSIYSAPFIKRYLAGHRLEIRPSARLQLGLSEVVVWGGDHRQLEAYYVNPFLPYYWEQLNADRDDNPLWSIDASWVIPRGPMLFGEFLIDDFQIDFESEPHQIGWQLGFRWHRPAGIAGSFVGFDWTRIEPGVYGQKLPYNRYLNHRVGIGSTLGPDGERYGGFWRQHLSQAWDVTAFAAYRRSGERTIETPQTGGEPNDPFPTGVVETTTRLEALIEYQTDAHLRAALRGGYAWRDNADHVPGLTKNGGWIAGDITIYLWHSGSF